MKKKRMRIDDLERIDRDYRLPSEVGMCIDTDPQTIRIQARVSPDLLGFPVIVAGTRVKIPKLPFINMMRGEEDVSARNDRPAI